ncbi:MAG: cupin domain-containing protein [Pseudomonadota bacterium]
MHPSAQQVIAALDLAPHPEGGWFRQTWIAETSAPRASGTAIYYLLAAGEASHWHRIDSAEIWHFYAGAPLALSLSEHDDSTPARHTLGPEIMAGQRPQIIVPPGHWQSARSTGDWSLVGCTVSPGFEFDHFELAPPGWSPGA